MTMRGSFVASQRCKDVERVCVLYVLLIVRGAVVDSDVEPLRQTSRMMHATTRTLRWCGESAPSGTRLGHSIRRPDIYGT